ncbi:MAG: FtsH protease activity modulator HflK [Sutterellaceae bacterium]|nr:FtsH protease activity modulator HflK [Sutterellaceae bacterium]
MSLNDPQWGRKPSQNDEGNANQTRPENDNQNDRDDDRRNDDWDNRNDNRDRKAKGSDLDQLWDDFNNAIGQLLGTGGKKNDNRSQWNQDRDDRTNDNYEDARDNRSDSVFDRDDRDSGNVPPPPPPRHRNNNRNNNGINFSMKSLALVVGALVVGWAATGIYIVPEGQVGVVTTFGRYTQDSAAGINWRMPWPIQDVEIVDVSSVRKAEIGIRGGSQRLSEALMLTDDENIVDVMFNVQYRIKPHQAKDFLFRTRDPDASVFGAAESAMREVVGRKTMDSVLFESKQEIAESVRQIMQQMLDRYETGIEVMSVAIQNAQPPQQVQAAFNDAVKAGQDRERQINEGQAYANAVVPAARGLASRLTQEAEGYKARVVENATGDAERFSKVLAEYEKAPQVTRDRLYIDAMKDIYSNTKKVLVESKSGSNLLYLPFEKLLEQSAPKTKVETPAATTSTVTQPVTTAPATTNGPVDLDTSNYMRYRSR